MRIFQIEFIGPPVSFACRLLAWYNAMWRRYFGKNVKNNKMQIDLSLTTYP